jgi:hypothetical protein
MTATTAGSSPAIPRAPGTGDRDDFSFAFRLPAPPDRVFPLLCPIREYDWIDGWACELVYSASGVAERDCVFVTERPEEGRTIWVASLHDPVERRVDYVRVTPGLRVVVMKLAVAAGAQESCEVRIRYTVTSLGERGAQLLERDRREGGGGFAQAAARIERTLRHFVTTGEKLPLRAE